jgi:hypothetical protein
MTMRLPQPIVTREHGSWAVLFVPIAIAVVIADGITWDIALVIIAALSAFMTYVPAQMILRDRFRTKLDSSKLRAATFWLIVYALVGSTAVVPLAAKGYWKLLPLGMFAVICFALNFVLTRVRSKTVLSDLVAVAGLTTGAPAVLYVATGEFSGTTFFVWVLNVLFFGSSVVYVHMKIAATGFKGASLSLKQRLSLGILNVVYHLVVLGIVLLLVVFECSPTLLAMAFVPMTVHALYGTLKLSARVQFKRLGMLLLGHAILFAIVVSTASLS